MRGRRVALVATAGSLEPILSEMRQSVRVTCRRATSLGTLATLMLGVVAAAGAASQATLPGANGKIAFGSGLNDAAGTPVRVPAGAAAGAFALTAATATCRSGSTPAVVAGKHVCLKAGARCTARLDRAYHRYRFHCHNGRLRRFPSKPAPPPQPTPPPQLAPPPTLPDPPAPSGQLVDIGGYRLLLECVGTAAPTVVFEAGAGANRGGGPRRIQHVLGSDTRVCTYDRPGTGGGASDPRPAGIAPTSETFARELHTLLANAGVPGPYLLVGGSFGGLLISAFAAWYPDDVAGLVFVDALAPGSAESYMLLKGRPEEWDARADLERLRTLSFGSRPVIVLASYYVREIPDFRRRATNMIAAEAPQYGHNIWGEVPGLAYEAIRVAVAAVRAGGPLPPCANTPLARLVSSCTP